MSKYIVEVAAAFVGSLGFCMLFRLRKQLMPMASLGGALAWIVYLVMLHYAGSIFIATLCASAFGTIYSEILARVMRTPDTLFILPSMVPLIPGGALYYMMSYLVQSNKTAAGVYGEMVMLYTVAIAGGISIVSALWSVVHKIIFAKKQKL